MESSKVALLSLSPPSTDFNFNSGCSTPYISAPSSPARIPNLFNSDSHLVNQLYRKLPSFQDADQRSSGLAEENDFAFDFGRKGDGYESVFPEELFDGGKIRPLKTELKVKPVKAEINTNPNVQISQGHRSSFSQPSTRATQITGDIDGAPPPEMTSSRSLLLVRETVSFWDMFPFSKQYRKWKLKNLLFRSASEGHNDAVARSSSKQSNDAVRVSSFWSIESSSSSGSVRRRRSVSAHELHYTMNRAASRELKRRTYLPYKQGLLGCLGFRYFTDVGSMTRGQSYGSGWSQSD